MAFKDLVKKAVEASTTVEKKPTIASLAIEALRKAATIKAKTTEKGTEVTVKLGLLPLYVFGNKVFKVPVTPDEGESMEAAVARYTAEIEQELNSGAQDVLLLATQKRLAETGEKTKAAREAAKAKKVTGEAVPKATAADTDLL